MLGYKSDKLTWETVQTSSTLISWKIFVCFFTDLKCVFYLDVFQLLPSRCLPQQSHVMLQWCVLSADRMPACFKSGFPTFSITKFSVLIITPSLTAFDLMNLNWGIWGGLLYFFLCVLMGTHLDLMSIAVLSFLHMKHCKNNQRACFRKEFQQTPAVNSELIELVPSTLRGSNLRWHHYKKPTLMEPWY